MAYVYLKDRKGIIKSDISVRNNIVYMVVIIESVVLQTDKQELVLKQDIIKYRFYNMLNDTNKLELLGLLYGITHYGKDYKYYCDNQTAVSMLKDYKDIDVMWIPREQNKKADRLSRTTKGYKRFPKSELNHLIQLVEKVTNKENYIVTSEV